MWPFGRNNKHKPEIRANSVTVENGEAVIDVRGQTCPGYLLAINKAVAPLAPGTPARLLISYPPCGEDVVHWCKERDIRYLGMTSESGLWTVRIQK